MIHLLDTADKVYCFVDLGNVRRLGVIVKANPYTMWVRIMLGARTSIVIKRHKLKHNLGSYYQTLYHPIEVT
jgi:hypothetical protein